MKTWIAIGALLTFLASLPASGQAGYQGIWLNMAPYTQSVSRIEVNGGNPATLSLMVWEGLPASAARRGMGRLAYRPASDGTVNRLMARRVTAEVAELYFLDLQSDGTFWVLRHVAQAGTRVRCDTMQFARLRYPNAVGKRGEYYPAQRPPATPVLVAHTPRP